MNRLFLSLMLLLALAMPSFADAPKKVLLIGQGPDGHPAQTHEYLAGVTILEKCLKPVKGLEITTVKADGAWKGGPELIERSDCVVLFVSEGAKWLQAEPKRLEALQKMAKRGGGLLVLHWGMGCRDAQFIEPFVQLFGGCHGGPDRKYQIVDTDLAPVETKHPILTGIGSIKLKEEFYYQLKFVKVEKGFQPLLQATIDGKEETVSWAWERPDGGRSFGFSGLHFHENWKKTEYRRLVSQAALWTLKTPIPEKGLAVGVTEPKFFVMRVLSRIMARNFEPGFFVEHFIKDMGIALEEAKRMNSALPGLALVNQLYRTLKAQGFGRKGTQSLMLAIEPISNVKR